MKTKTKKGFTLVELVIVIAVIAILAAVLIPTFSSLVNKANQSADIQAVRQMNTVLSVEKALDSDSSIYDVKIALSENGLNSTDYKALTSGYAFYYDTKNVCIVLVNGEGIIEYPKSYEGSKIGKTHILLSSGKGSMTKVKKVSDAESLFSAIQNDADATTMITLTSNVELDEDKINGINTALDDGKSVNIDLGGNTLTNGKNLSYCSGSLYIENGTIKTSYSDENNVHCLTVGKKAQNGQPTEESLLHLNGVTLTVNNEYNEYSSNKEWSHTTGVHLEENASCVIENSTITAGTYGVATNNAKSSNVYLEITKSTISAEDNFGAGFILNIDASAKISESKISGDGIGVFVRLGTVNIVDSEISKTNIFVHTDFKDAWKNGTCVNPYTTLIVGDKSDSYPGKAIVTLTNCTLSTAVQEGKTVVVSSDKNTTASFSYDDSCQGVQVNNLQ